MNIRTYFQTRVSEPSALILSAFWSHFRLPVIGHTTDTFDQDDLKNCRATTHSNACAKHARMHKGSTKNTSGSSLHADIDYERLIIVSAYILFYSTRVMLFGVTAWSFLIGGVDDISMAVFFYYFYWTHYDPIFLYDSTDAILSDQYPSRCSSTPHWVKGLVSTHCCGDRQVIFRHSFFSSTYEFHLLVFDHLMMLIHDGLRKSMHENARHSSIFSGNPIWSIFLLTVLYCPSWLELYLGSR
jgi:hypothetical protein